MSSTPDGTTPDSAAGHAQAAPNVPAYSEAICNVAWVADEQTREAMIRLAAYTFYERRGYASGSELADWLEAEMEVDRQLAAVQPTGHAPEGTPEHLHTIAPVQTRARVHAELPAQTAAKAAVKTAAKTAPKAAAKAASKAASKAPAKSTGKSTAKPTSKAATKTVVKPAAIKPTAAKPAAKKKAAH